MTETIPAPTIYRFPLREFSDDTPPSFENTIGGKAQRLASGIAGKLRSIDGAKGTDSDILSLVERAMSL